MAECFPEDVKELEYLVVPEVWRWVWFCYHFLPGISFQLQIKAGMKLHVLKMNSLDFLEQIKVSRLEGCPHLRG